LIGDVDWINDFFAGRDKGKVPNIITPVAFLLKEHRKTHKPYMEAGTMRTLLGIVDSRLSDYKESAGYFSGVLVFLGLLGTFWGLLLTIGSVGDVVRNLDIVGGNVGAMFESLKANISKPLSGMGTAFSTSLFGLGSSLILGFLQLQTNLAQHFFYNELEENMTRYTRIISASALAEGGDGSIITYLQAMLEQTGDNINKLQKTVMKSIDNNAEISRKIAVMAEETSKLATQMQEKLKVMEKISVAPEKLYPVLNDLVKISKSGFGMDDKTRDHIRNMDLGLSDMTEKLSSDIRLLAKTVAMTSSETKKDKK
ncbi:MAG: flagellar motor protein MotA, partial [Alphaproteobacteria bacterium]|nr:flagellar motor protein MotA [Alphaproteobacteria bacterium]